MFRQLFILLLCLIPAFNNYGVHSDGETDTQAKKNLPTRLPVYLKRSQRCWDIAALAKIHTSQSPQTVPDKQLLAAVQFIKYQNALMATSNTLYCTQHQTSVSTGNNP